MPDDKKTAQPHVNVNKPADTIQPNAGLLRDDVVEALNEVLYCGALVGDG